jgi:hypothetical protein
MASREANIGNKNLGTKRLSNGFCIGIPIIQLIPFQYATN